MTHKAKIRRERKDKPGNTVSAYSSTELKTINDKIEILIDEIKAGNKVEDYRYHVGKAFTFVAMGLGVQFLPVSSFTNVPPAILALLMYVIAGLETATAFETHQSFKEDWHKKLNAIGLIIVATGAGMVSLPFLRVLPAFFAPFGLPTIILGFLVMEISIILNLFRKRNKSR